MNTQASAPQPGGERQRKFFQLVGIPEVEEKFLPFVIPDLDRDLEKGMYVTAALAAKHPNPTVKAFFSEIQSYFQCLEAYLVRARAGDQDAYLRARRMVQCPEVPEIRFGYTREGHRGKGIGQWELSEHIFQMLFQNPALSRACAEEPDALAFIPNVSLDRVSDLFATIGKRHLIEYTESQAQRRGFTGMKRVVVKGVWDSSSERLADRIAVLPKPAGGPAVLLVAKGILRSSPPVREEQYAARFHGGARMSKEEVLSDAALFPDRLIRTIREVLEDDWRFRPRRDFRDDLTD
jgi:GNAT superfamily N-acetyltransferase